MVARLGLEIEETYASPITFDEWIVMPLDRERTELLNGELIVAPDANDRHQDIQMELAYQFRRAAERVPGAKIRAGGNVRVSTGDGLIPDVIVFTGKAGGKHVDYGFDGPPDLVVEILSPSNRKYDLVTKSSRYAALGVPEYWIVDPSKPALIVGKLLDGEYIRSVYSEGTVHCDALDGAVIDLGFLKQE
jgi:Uma2 family endonuclease